MAGGHDWLRAFDERVARWDKSWIAGTALHEGVIQRWLRPARIPMVHRERFFVHQMNAGLLQWATSYKTVGTHMANRQSAAQYGPIIFAHPRVTAGAVQKLQEVHGDGDELDGALLQQVCAFQKHIVQRVTCDFRGPKTHLDNVFWGHSFGGLVATERAAMSGEGLLIPVTAAGMCNPPEGLLEWGKRYRDLAWAGRIHSGHVQDSIYLDGSFVATMLMNVPTATRTFGRLATRPAPHVDDIAGRLQALSLVAPADEVISEDVQRRLAERLGASVIELPATEPHAGFIFGSPPICRAVDGVMNGLERSRVGEQPLSNDAIAAIQASVSDISLHKAPVQSLGLRLSTLVAGSQVGRSAS